MSTWEALEQLQLVKYLEKKKKKAKNPQPKTKQNHCDIHSEVQPFLRQKIREKNEIRDIWAHFADCLVPVSFSVSIR